MFEYILMRHSTKHRTVRRSLEAAIEAGEFMPGDQIPSEIDLAERYGVSYMTARKAVGQLVAEDLLERRASKGTFVRHMAQKKLARQTLNLVVSSYEGSNTKEFLRPGILLAQNKGWNANIVRLTPDQQDPAVRAISNGELAMVMIDDIRAGSALWLAMRSARGKAISFHQNVAAAGIPTIRTDPLRDMRLAFDCLRGAGHERIAFVSQFPSDEHSPEPIVSWQKDALEVLGSLDYPLHVVRVDLPLFASPMKPCYDAITRCLAQHPDITAFISKSDELTMAALAACRDSRRPSPEHISIVNLGNWPTMEYTDPPVTCVDFNFEAQFRAAEAYLDRAIGGHEILDPMSVVEGFIVDRRSVQPPPVVLRAIA